jgi:hypothetical protein
MSSAGPSSRDRQWTITPVGGPAGDSSLLGDVAHLRLVGSVVGDPDAAVACAAAALERVERAIDQLWFDAMKAEDLSTSQRLADVSHALHRAGRLLEPDNAIG